MPKISGVLETALYCEDLARAKSFYAGDLELRVMFDSTRLVAFDIGGDRALLLFQRGMTSEDVHTPGGLIPGHDGSGPAHMAFAIPTEEYEPWRSHLAARGIAIRSEVVWRAGGKSLYFNDPDGHVIELATPGLWPNY
jgi:catechol 2,3-dioxygenase-like lactoylglutathione lyase family enzyme